MADPEFTTPDSAAEPFIPKDVALKKALVVTDFSPDAAAAIDYAVKLAKLAGIQIALLHIVEVSTYQIHPEVVAARKRVDETFEAMRQRAAERLEGLAEIVRNEGVNCAASVRLGIPTEEILTEAEMTKPDLIFIGNKGTSALARFLLGSTAERVVRYARCSVLVVRAKAE
jgi:nucleotide-binding universal stress UspA family protein